MKTESKTYPSIPIAMVEEAVIVMDQESYNGQHETLKYVDADLARNLARKLTAAQTELAAAESKLNLIRIEAEERDKNNSDISPAWILQTLEE